MAVDHIMKLGLLKETPIIDTVAAISCGIYEGTPVLDLDYAEDSTAHTDANFVLTGGAGLLKFRAPPNRKRLAKKNFSNC
jgi:ribonuclease PH